MLVIPLFFQKKERENVADNRGCNPHTKITSAILCANGVYGRLSFSPLPPPLSSSEWCRIRIKISDIYVLQWISDIVEQKLFLYVLKMLYDY